MSVHLFLWQDWSWTWVGGCHWLVPASAGPVCKPLPHTCPSAELGAGAGSLCLFLAHHARGAAVMLCIQGNQHGAAILNCDSTPPSHQHLLVASFIATLPAVLDGSRHSTIAVHSYWLPTQAVCADSAECHAWQTAGTSAELGQG